MSILRNPQCTRGKREKERGERASRYTATKNKSKRDWRMYTSTVYTLSSGSKRDGRASLFVSRALTRARLEIKCYRIMRSLRLFYDLVVLKRVLLVAIVARLHYF